MDHKIAIKSGKEKALAILSNSETAKAIWDSLPIESTCNTWGDEVYFGIPISMPLDETAKEIVDMGDLGYWPAGRALCIFFGPTPISEGDEIRPASAVNIIGKVEGDPKVLKRISAGTGVCVEKAE